MGLFEIIFSLIFVFCLFNAVPTALMAFLVLKPLANARENDPVKQKKLFWKYFWIRIVILLVLCFFTVFSILTLDFIICIIMAIFVVPKQKIMVDNSIQAGQMTNPSVVTTSQPQNLNASVSNPQVVVNNVQPQEGVETRKPVLPTSFDPMYRNTEEKMLEIFINKELQKAKINKYIGLIPTDALKRKKIMNIIVLFLLFVLISMVFFHFPIYSYIIGAIIILIVYKSSRKFDLTVYLKKELKARPSEKVSNIIMNAKNTLVKDDSNKIFVIGIIIAIALPLLIFIKPRIIYEKMDNGYGVRFYTFGLTNFTSATIPETYKGEKVVSLRGNTFSNMFFLKDINLPDSITEIRGQAFKNLYFLEEIKLPNKLEYLGGGAFYNCKKLKSIVIPDTVTEMGGEAFYNATSLESVKLSTNITEIRGNTFENCSSLKSITIPDKVTRIGGHAFYANSSLSEVIITENSELIEIGSSAFRLCDSLYEITIPVDTYVNERAFKESPTQKKYYYNSESIDNITGSNAWIDVNKPAYFADYNINIDVNRYNYDVFTRIGSGTIKINFNDTVYKNVLFNFSSNDFQDMEKDVINFTYLDYNFKINSFSESGINMTITKNTNYLHLENKVSYSFSREGDSYKLRNSNYEIKLEKKENIGGRYNYYFTCNGEKFDHEIGNGYFNTATYGNDEVKIQISSLYGNNGIYLNIYYN